MDKVTRYQQLLQQLVNRYAEYQPSHGQIITYPICDVTQHHYMLLDVGWDNTGRVHAVAFHARLDDGKVWIEWDGTDPSLTEALMAAGIPATDLVLGYYRPEYRALAGIATA
ncbi:MAG: XisI protein [Anaerolineales bacterium]|nr:XisI protein [Anaerolineales bacterium]MCB9127454.1 XisI protein [Ardenticatenales bacterium]MCB9172213.1 XisI protein [Ardenticatenales bacterium]